MDEFRSAALYSNWRPGSPHKPSSSSALSHKASEPSILVSPGPEGPARLAGLWGRGGEDLPPLPPCCPSLLTGMNHVIFAQWQVRWMGRTPRRWSPWQANFKKEWNKNCISRQDRKHFNINLFLCPFGPPPSPLECSEHLQYVLTWPPQGKKYLLHHKDELFFFWPQPCDSLEDNTIYLWPY